MGLTGAGQRLRPGALQAQHRRRRSTPTSTRTTWTPWLGDRALDLVDGADGFDFADGGQFLYYASYSPHTPYAYPPELEGSFADEQYPRTPDFNEADVSDKFGLTRTRKPLSEADIATIDETFRKRIRSVQVLDQNVAPWCRSSTTRARWTTPT